MKKIQIESCVTCPFAESNGFLGGDRCQKAKIDFIPLSGIHPDCPLNDDEPSIPVSVVQQSIDELTRKIVKYGYQADMENAIADCYVLRTELEKLLPNDKNRK